MGISEARTTQTRHSCRGANFTLTTVGAVSRSMEEDILAGLKSTPKTIPAKYLYDAEGSRLFDRICGLPEYYLTRTETAILKRHADEILTRIGQKLCVIELGAGACHKGRLLLESGNVSTFVPVDISTAYLRSAGLRIAGSFPYISVHAVAMDFLAALSSLELLLPHDGRRLLFYAGSSIGNFDPSDACRVLGQIRRNAAPRRNAFDRI